MYLIPIAWLYVVILVAAAEETIVAAVLTFVFWGLAPLALFLWLANAGARLILAEATAIDLTRREVQVAGRPALGFDLLDQLGYEGPMARSVADVRLLFDALRGPHAGDRHGYLAGTDEARAAVRKLVKDGIEWVKTYPTGDAAAPGAGTAVDGSAGWRRDTCSRAPRVAGPTMPSTSRPCACWTAIRVVLASMGPSGASPSPPTILRCAELWRGGWIRHWMSARRSMARMS